MVRGCEGEEEGGGGDFLFFIIVNGQSSIIYLRVTMYQLFAKD